MYTFDLGTATSRAPFSPHARSNSALEPRLWSQYSPRPLESTEKKTANVKAFSTQASGLPGFASAKITALTTQHITLQIMPSFSANLGNQDVNVRWFQRGNNIITLCPASPSGS